MKGVRTKNTGGGPEGEGERDVVRRKGRGGALTTVGGEPEIKSEERDRFLQGGGYRPKEREGGRGGVLRGEREEMC